MGKAPKHGKQRQTQHSTTTTQQPLGISKLKAALRQAERFLRRDGLPADQRVEAQRRVESLQSQLRDAEASRPAVMADAPETPVGTMDRPKRVKSKTPAGGTDSYKMLRHFEYVKTARRVKSTRKEMARVEEQLANVKNADNPDEKDAKKLKSRLKKDRKRLEEDLMDRRVDAWYVEVSVASALYKNLDILTISNNPDISSKSQIHISFPARRVHLAHPVRTTQCVISHRQFGRRSSITVCKISR